MAKQLELVRLSDYHKPIVAKIEIFQDQCPSSPREWDNLGEMVIRKAMDRYFCGDRLVNDEEMSELINRCRVQELVWRPIYALIHSGVWLSTTESFNGYTCNYDTSFAGVIYAENDKMIEYFEDYKDLSKSIREVATSNLEFEVQAYHQYLTGDVYGYRMLDPDGEEVDSCWGFYGSDPFDNGMSDAIDSKYHDLLKQAAESVKYG